MRKRDTPISTRKSFVNVLMGTASLVKLSVTNVSLDGMEHSAISLVEGRKRLRQ